MATPLAFESCGRLAIALGYDDDQGTLVGSES
jgi:hypothetical protein